MELIYKGKTKDVYKLSDGNILFKFKDDATGADGVFDPGANTVGLSIEGLGRQSLALSKYYFEILNNLGIPTHYISGNLEECTMTVRPVHMFGQGVETICRLKADGSFIRRYGAYVKTGQDLDYLVEFTLKDNERQDPPATKDTLVMLGIMSGDEYEEMKDLTKKITRILKKDLSGKGLELYDIKYEFAKIDGRISLADEISGGVMRIYHNGNIVAPMELNELILKGAK